MRHWDLTPGPIQPTKDLGWREPKPISIRDRRLVGYFLSLSVAILSARSTEAVAIVKRNLSYLATIRRVPRKLPHKPMQTPHLFQLTARSHRCGSYSYFCAVGVCHNICVSPQAHLPNTRLLVGVGGGPWIEICCFDMTPMPRVVVSGSSKNEDIASPMLDSGRSSGLEYCSAVQQIPMHLKQLNMHTTFCSYQSLQAEQHGNGGANPVGQGNLLKRIENEYSTLQRLAVDCWLLRQ